MGPTPPPRSQDRATGHPRRPTAHRAAGRGQDPHQAHRSARLTHHPPPPTAHTSTTKRSTATREETNGSTTTSKTRTAPQPLTKITNSPARHHSIQDQEAVHTKAS